MPHLVLEYTANLLPDFEPAQALNRMYTVLLASGEFVPEHIKSRAVRLDDYLVGDAAPGSFLHARLHLLAGREQATKQAIVEGLVAALRSCIRRLYWSGVHFIGIMPMGVGKNSSGSRNSFS